MDDAAFAEFLDLLRLTRTEGLGPKTIRHVIARFGCAREAVAHRGEWLKRGADIAQPSVAEREVEAAARANLHHISWDDPHYPEALRAIEDAPPVLVIKGDTGALSQPMIAMVGARNASANGRIFAKSLARDLAKTGLIVISGLARGIDGAAHDGALMTGRTVAVLAGGTDVIYPPEHAKLYDRIAEAGAVISEMPPGTPPIAAFFPRRNRIISGASLGVVVVEATLKSGSLITARYAADQGREVFAVPGSPLDPRAQGPNSLIRDGAALIQSLDDIISNFPHNLPFPQKIPLPVAPPQQTIDKSENSNPSTARRIIEAALGPTPAAVDELVRQCQVSPAILAMVLLELELAGRLERLPGNRVALLGV